MYLAYELTVGIWFKFSGTKVRNVANELHLEHFFPVLLNAGDLEALRGLVGLEAAVAGMWAVRYSYIRFPFDGGEHSRQAKSAQTSLLPYLWNGILRSYIRCLALWMRA